MKMKLKKLILALTLSGVFALAACNVKPNEGPDNNGGSGTEDVTRLEGLKITAEGNVTKLAVGKTLKLTAVPTPASASASVNWSSSHQEIATINEQGVVSGLKPGLTVIKAVSKENDKISAEFSLTIETAKTPDATSIELTTKDNVKEVEVGKTLKITATVTPSEADQNVKFTSSDEKIAKITNAGILTALKEGKVTITAISTKNPTIKQTIEITVKASTYVPDEKWKQMEFSNHEAYMTAEKDTQLKVKGTVTHVVADAKDETKVSYFIQNGNEGFYIKGHVLTMGSVEVGASYAVGGYKEFKSGCNAIANVAYFEKIEEQLPVNVIDLTGAKDLSYEGQKANMGSKAKLTDVVISNLPTSYTKAFSVRVKNASSEIDIRISPSEMTKEEFNTIAETVKNLNVGQVISVEGIMTSFGYGKPASQILLTASSNLTAKPLDDAAKVKLAADGISLPFSLDKDVATITLPTVNSKFKEVKLTWTSNSELINVKDGTVTHSDRDTLVTLTVEASLNGKTAQKSFVVNVFSKNDDYLTEVGKLDFEDALPADKNGCSGTKPSYKNGNVQLGGHNWALNNALIGADERDHRNGQFGARIQIKDGDNSITLLDALEFNTLEFVTAIYGENLLGPVLQISYAVGDSNEFVKLDTTYEINDYNMHKIRVKLPVEKGSKVRIKIEALSGHGQRVNIDDIRLLLEA